MKTLKCIVLVVAISFSFSSVQASPAPADPVVLAFEQHKPKDGVRAGNFTFHLFNTGAQYCHLNVQWLPRNKREQSKTYNLKPYSHYTEDWPIFTMHRVMIKKCGNDSTVWR